MEVRFANPIHPGEMLREEFLKPLDLSAGKLAKAIGVPRTRIERVLREESGISADTASRLGRYFRTSAQLWLNMQTSYELNCIHNDKKRLAALDEIKPLERADLGEAA